MRYMLAVALLVGAGLASAAAYAQRLGEEIPYVLSEKDVKVYQELFRMQRALERAEVVKTLPKLGDDLLMGHLIAERLLHPSTKSSYTELKRWLDTYHDHPQARRIHTLAEQRKPREKVHKEPSVKKQSLARYSAEEQIEVEADKPAGDSRKRNKLMNELRGKRLKGDYTHAHALLKKSSTRQVLGDSTWNQVALTLSRSMMLGGEHAAAISLASYVYARAPELAPEALWIMGFSAYRKGDKKQAVEFFRRLVYAVPPTSGHYARAAWWTARTFEELHQHNQVPYFLHMAALDPFSFYGQMAQSRINKNPQEKEWRQPRIAKEHQMELFTNSSVRRAIALVQIGEHDLAQKELKSAYDSFPYGWDESLLALALGLDLPNVAMTLSRNLMEQHKTYLNGLYPLTTSWEPQNGLKVDRALLHAVMRQESAFQPAVVSSAGARGLMQIMPGTARFIIDKNDLGSYSKEKLNNPAYNMMLGQKYLMYLEEKLDANLLYMIAAYNAGPGNVRRWLETMPEIADDPVLFVESIPFRETRHYVQKVLANLWMYRKRLQQDTPILTALSENTWPVRVVTLTLSNDG